MNLETQLASIMVESGLDHFKAERAAKRMIDFFNEKLNEEIKKGNGLTPNERKLAAEMLTLAKEEFSNHGCNDLEESIWDGWSLQERKEFVKSCYEQMGDVNDFDESDLHLGDSEIMDFLAHKLSK